MQLYVSILYTLYLSSNLKPGVVVSKRLSCVLRGFSTSSFSVQRSPGFGWVGRRHCHFGKLGKHEKVQTISRKNLMEQLLWWCCQKQACSIFPRLMLLLRLTCLGAYPPSQRTVGWWAGNLFFAVMAQTDHLHQIALKDIDAEPWSSFGGAPGCIHQWRSICSITKFLAKAAGYKCHNFWCCERCWAGNFCCDRVPLPSWSHWDWHFLCCCNWTAWRTRGAATECQCSLHFSLGSEACGLPVLQSPSYSYGCSTRWVALKQCWSIWLLVHLICLGMDCIVASCLSSWRVFQPFGLLSVGMMGLALEFLPQVFCWRLLLIGRNGSLRKDPSSRGKFCDVGVWQLSQHPNWFGNFLLWSGICALNASTLAAVGPLYILPSLLSPLFLLALFYGQACGTISNTVELANAKHGHDPAYQEYIKKVPVFMPSPSSMLRLCWDSESQA